MSESSIIVTVQAAITAAKQQAKLLRPGREVSLVLTKLEEAELWLSKVKVD